MKDSPEENGNEGRLHAHSFGRYSENPQMAMPTTTASTA
jgi:hypothetical protein